jgi:hypothetical protein
VKLLDTALVHRVRRSPALRPAAIAAYRAADRLMPAPPGPRVVANSMPKSGTHLLTSLLDQLEGMRFTGRIVMFTEMDRHAAAEARVRELDRRLARLRPSHYLATHMIHDARAEQLLLDRDIRLVTILRDPRAVVVSALHYLRDARWMTHRGELMDALPDERSVLEALVRGHGEPGDPYFIAEIGGHYRAYARWAASSAGLTVRFEDMVGRQGGGSDDVQVEQVGRILDHLGYRSDGESAADVARRLFSERSITFRTGRIDAWRTDLPAELSAEIEQRCGDSMARLGYA